MLMLNQWLRFVFSFPFGPYFPSQADMVNGGGPDQREIVDGMGYPIRPLHATGRSIKGKLFY